MSRILSNAAEQRANRRANVRSGVKRRLKKTRHALIELMGFVALGASVAFLASPSLVNAMFSESAFNEPADIETSQPRDSFTHSSTASSNTGANPSGPFFSFEIANRNF